MDKLSFANSLRDFREINLLTMNDNDPATHVASQFRDNRVFAVPATFKHPEFLQIYCTTDFASVQHENTPVMVFIGSEVDTVRLKQNLPKLNDIYGITSTLDQLSAARDGACVRLR